MNSYLLDTNHLSAYIDHHSTLEPRVDAGLRAGHRFGITLPVLCEYRAGIVRGKHHQRNLRRLESVRHFLRLWPLDENTAFEFAALDEELRRIGRILSPFDNLIAAGAHQYAFTLLTADNDFSLVPRLHVENWLV